VPDVDFVPILPENGPGKYGDGATIIRTGFLNSVPQMESPPNSVA